MSKAIPTPTTSRRRLLSGGAALAAGAAIAGAAGCIPTPAPDAEAAAAVMPGAGADAELIALCGEVIALQDQADALDAAFGDLDGDEPNADGDTYDDLVDGLSDQQRAVVACICKLPCRTPAGERAIAESFAKIDGNALAEGNPDANLLRALHTAVMARA